MCLCMKKKYHLLLMFWLIVIYFCAEIILGYITNSLAMIVDSLQVFSNVASLVIAFLSMKMSPKKWSQNTFGWARAEVLGAHINAVFLVALCFSVVVQAVKRLVVVENIKHPKLILVVGTIGIIVNILSSLSFHDSADSQDSDVQMWLSNNHCRLSRLLVVNNNAESYESAVNLPNESLQKGRLSQMNMRMISNILLDSCGSVVVITSATVLWLTNWNYKLYVDPALSLVMVILILRSVWPLLQESALILLQTVPTHIQVEAIQRKLLDNIDEVLSVHEFHVWQLAGDRIIASAHISCKNLPQYMKIAGKVKEFFHNEGIHSTTIQPEFIELPEDKNVRKRRKSDCALDCPKTSCVLSTCCGPSKHCGD